MSLYVMGDMVFVDLDCTKGVSKVMLCIGTKAEIEGADETKILNMIRQAVAMSEFRQIEVTKGLTLH